MLDSSDSYTRKMALATKLLHESISSFLLSELEHKGFPGATESNLKLLSCLDDKTLYGSEIARKLGVSRQMVAKSIKEMTQLGYLKQQEAEGKQKPIALTPHGEALLEEANQQLEKMDQRIEEQVGSLQMKAMVNLLDKLNHSLQE